MSLVTGTFSGLWIVFSRLPIPGHPYLTMTRGFTAYKALPMPSTCTSPSPRQHILWLSQWRWLLGESLPVPYPVDTSSGLRTARGYSVPPLRMALHEGPHSSPGFSGVSLGRMESRPAPSRAFWPKPIIRVGLFNLTTIQTWIRLPVHMQLCSAGFPVGFRVTAFSPRFAD